MNHTRTDTHPNQALALTLCGAEAWFAAEQVSGAQQPGRQTRPWFSEVAVSGEPQYLTIKRWAPMVRVVYDYYPYGLTWENPKLPNDPEGVHDHAYQDKEFQMFVANV